MGVVTGLLTVIAGGMLAAGVWEARDHRNALDAIPLRVHVNGTRGKSSVTRAIATLFRELGKTSVGKCTGTLPVIIERDGRERRLKRRGRTRVQEQVRFLRYAAQQRADVAVVECMAVDPMLQWVCEHRFVRSNIGVITNVRGDHFEEMGGSLDEIARCLANTIPRNGVLVTAEHRFASLFEAVAASLGTRIVLVDDEDVRRAAALWGGVCETGRGVGAEGDRPDGDNRGDGPDGDNGGDGRNGSERGNQADGALENILDEVLRAAFAENVAVACTVARLAGFSEEEVAQAARALPRPRLHVTALRSVVQRGRLFPRLLVHAWSMNDTDSFRALFDAFGGSVGVASASGHEGAEPTESSPTHPGRTPAAGAGQAALAESGWHRVPLYNHRSDRPLRALEFGRVFASEGRIARVLVTGDAGGARLLMRAGVSVERIRTIPSPLTMDGVADVVRDIPGPVVVVGCGNARGVEHFELGGQIPTAARPLAGRPLVGASR